MKKRNVKKAAFRCSGNKKKKNNSTSTEERKKTHSSMVENNFIVRNKLKIELIDDEGFLGYL